MSIGDPTIRKIKALQSKTTARGATEHEAEAAAAKASELMTAHNVSAEDMQWDDKIVGYAAGVKARYVREKEEERARRARAKAARRRTRQLIEEHGLAKALAIAVKDAAGMKYSVQAKILETVQRLVSVEREKLRRGF
jgi:hypothetical protein